MKGNTPSSSNISQKPRGFGVSSGNCCGPLAGTQSGMWRRTQYRYFRIAFYRFLCMISFVPHICGVWGRQELFSLSNEETGLEGLIEDSRGR